MEEIILEDIKKLMKNYRLSQEYLKQCPEEIRVFLEPTINLAGDFICYICYEKGLDPTEIEL